MTGFMLYQKLNGKWRDDKMSDKYQNTELIPEERAAYLLEELSLDEKVAQLNCVFPFDKASYDFAGINEQTKHGIGQVSTLEMRRMESLDEVVRWQRKVVLKREIPSWLCVMEEKKGIRNIRKTVTIIYTLSLHLSSIGKKFTIS